MKRSFSIGDHVRLSAMFLRSVGRNYSLIKGQSGLTPDDRGVGVVIGFAPDWGEIAFIRWDGEPAIARSINVINLIHAAEAHLDSMHAEDQDLRALRERGGA